MTPIADMVAEMMARGLPADVIVLAVRTAELAVSGGIRVDTAAEKRRAWDRQRKAEKRHSTGNSTGIPPDAEIALSLSSSKNSEAQKKEEKKERSRGIRIPPDWRPNVGHYAAGEQLGYTRQGVDEQAEDMRLWAQSNEHRAVARKSDWDMTFLGWLRRNKPKKVNGHGTGTSVVATADRLIAEERLRQGSPDGPLLDLQVAGPGTS